MTINTKIQAQTALVALTLTLSAATAHAYVGPGLGLGTIVVILGVIGSIFLAIFAVFWYPFKRLLKKRKEAAAEENPTTAEATSANTDSNANPSTKE